MLVWSILLGCRSTHDAALADDPVDPEPVVAIFPPDGALHLWGDVPVEVVLGAAADPGTVEVSATRDGETAPLPCVLDYGGTLARCGELAGMEPGDEVQLDVSVDGATFHNETLGRLPKEGLGWSLLDGTTVTAVGGSQTAASALDGHLSEGSAFAALDGYDGTDGPWTFVASPAGTHPDGTFGVAPWGFGFLLPVEVTDGQLEGSADAAWLPVQVGANPVLLLLLDVSIRGRLDGEALEDLALSATLPALALESLSDALGALGPELLDLVELDVDRDGDGQPDAASLRLEGAPAPAALEAWDQP